MNIGSKIKRLRIANQLTLEELANRSELTKGFLSQVERNLTSPSITTLEDILEALGTTLHDFFSETQEEQIVFKKEESLKISYKEIKQELPHVVWQTLDKKYLIRWNIM